MQLPIYMDNHATTRVDPRVLDRMLPYFSEHYGNAASRQHSFGWRAEKAVDAARAQVAQLIGAGASEIVFTSGATEADNLAILGVAAAYAGRGDHIITQQTEHPAVLDACRYLESRGLRVTAWPVDRFGRVDPAAVQATIEPKTLLVSVMWVNNEIGTVQPVGAIGAICHEAGVLFHTDAVQAAATLPIDVNAAQVDLLSLSGHKLYGPKGIGALYVRRKKPRVRLVPMMHGGGHERGVRSGTLNVPAIVGFGEACRIVRELQADEAERLAGLRQRLFEQITRRADGVQLNGHPTERHPGNLNLSFAGVDGEMLLLRLRDVAVSSGAACASASRRPSHVLAALGLSPALAHSAIRFGLGRFNSAEEVDYVADLVIRSVGELRDANPAHSPGPASASAPGPNPNENAGVRGDSAPAG